jgi:hypothetical protein
LLPAVCELQLCWPLNYLKTSHQPKAWHTDVINDHFIHHFTDWAPQNLFLNLSHLLTNNYWDKTKLTNWCNYN